MTNNKIKQTKNNLSVRPEVDEKMQSLKKNTVAKEKNISTSKQTRAKDRRSEKPFLIL
ncbi:MAG TPA: hypothetical protein VIQ00_08625 [Chitinophagaceae bacterium]